MSIVAIVGSARKGNTYAMVEYASNRLKELGAEVELIHLDRYAINSCIGCLSCDQTGKCVIDDDMTELIKKVEDADGLIIGTPCRWNLMSGETKIFIDRLNPLAGLKKLPGKKGIIFAVGQSDERDVENAAKSVEMFFDSAEILKVGNVVAENCMNEGDVLKKKDILKRCEDAAVKLYEACK